MTFEEAIKNAGRLLDRAEGTDPDMARELIAAADTWVRIADLITEREREHLS